MDTDELSRQQRQVYDAIVNGPRASGPQHFPLVDAAGQLQGPFGLMVEFPEIGGPLQALGAALRYRTTLTGREREIAILTVARCTANSFERYAHEAAGRAAGLDETELARLHAGTFVTADAREAAVAMLTAWAVDQPTLTGIDRVTAQPLDRTSIAEVTALVGYYRTLAQLMGLFDIGAPADPN
ncbi:carboxymuconolactone decarboxylase family protein [Nocardia sp. NPDC055002]